MGRYCVWWLCVSWTQVFKRQLGVWLFKWPYNARWIEIAWWMWFVVCSSKPKGISTSEGRSKASELACVLVWKSVKGSFKVLKIIEVQTMVVLTLIVPTINDWSYLRFRLCFLSRSVQTMVVLTMNDPKKGQRCQTLRRLTNQRCPLRDTQEATYCACRPRLASSFSEPAQHIGVWIGTWWLPPWHVPSDRLRSSASCEARPGEAAA